MDSIYWLLLFILLLVIEVLTMGLTTIWFAGGALAAFLVSLVAGNILELEVAVFIIVSVILLIFTRPLAMRYLNRKTTLTNADSVVGSIVRVTEPVNNILDQGAAQADGKVWTARGASDDLLFEEGELAVVQEIRGVKLILQKKKED
ncbi:MAG: NfeD family protein [Lachnospiraceae bacterium]|nr:NfeD family protein [Lachnospiraceae bacterium]MBR6527817.1 NfeD family protein [Lachnospiraceae bacterium]